MTGRKESSTLGSFTSRKKTYFETHSFQLRKQKITVFLRKNFNVVLPPPLLKVLWRVVYSNNYYYYYYFSFFECRRLLLSPCLAGDQFLLRERERDRERARAGRWCQHQIGRKRRLAIYRKQEKPPLYTILRVYAAWLEEIVEGQDTEEEAIDVCSFPRSAAVAANRLAILS